MNRRKFIALLGGAAAWPLASRAQQTGGVRRIGMLLVAQENDPKTQANVAAFRDGLEKLGWTVGRNLQIDYRWTAGYAEELRTGAAELLRLAPDVVVTPATPILAAVRQATRTTPIVFMMVSEPVAQGFVASLANPGGNVTGFSNLEPTFAAKWPEMLKEIAPRLRHVSVMLTPEDNGTVLNARSAVAAAPGFGLESVFAPVHGPAEIEMAMATLAQEPGGGLILPLDSILLHHYKLIVELAARFGLPAISADREFVVAGGLVSYGVNMPAQFRQAATYVDRILRGEKPGDLPVQQPTKFELIINLKTAKALHLTVPPSLLVAADEVIE